MSENNEQVEKLLGDFFERHTAGDKEGMNVELDKAIRLYDFIIMGELVAYDALNRNENFFYVACWEYQGSDEKAPELLKEPLVYEAIKVQTRNYKS